MITFKVKESFIFKIKKPPHSYINLNENHNFHMIIRTIYAESYNELYLFLYAFIYRGSTFEYWEWCKHSNL